MSKEAKNDQDLEVVVEYLRTQNRPYNVNNIFENLHRKIGKTAIQRALDTACQPSAQGEPGRVCEKLNKKQKVYFYNQDLLCGRIDANEMQRMEEGIAQALVRVRELRGRVREKKEELRGLFAQKSKPELRESVVRLRESVAALEAEVGEIEGAEREELSPEQQENIVRTNERLVREWRKRKRLASEMVDAVLEGYPGKRQELMEEMAVETDEEAGSGPPPLPR